MTTADYYVPGPVDIGGEYQQSRGSFDSAVGWLDGLASAVGSVGNVVEGVTDISDDVAGAATTWEELQQLRDSNEQELALNWLTTERGDNIKLYAVIAAAAVAVIVLFR